MTTVYQAYRYSAASDLLEIRDNAVGRRVFEHDPAGQLLSLRTERGIAGGAGDGDTGGGGDGWGAGAGDQPAASGDAAAED
jgi:hypothetical protein